MSSELPSRSGGSLIDVTPLDAGRPTLAHQVYDALVEAVLERRIAPGDRLVMDQLAEAFDVSRTPVRDALLRLESEGLVEPAGRRGYEVRTVGTREVVELYQAREAIEGHSVRLLCASPDLERRVERIRVAIAAAADDSATTAAYVANRRVHRAFVEQSGNRPLLAAFDSLWGATLALFAYSQTFPVDVQATLEADHLGLVEAIAAGDPDEAHAAIVDHIRAGLAEHLA